MSVADKTSLGEALCIEEDRVVKRDNTVAYRNKHLQLPEGPLRRHYVKARVKVREYPDTTLAIFHGPRRLAPFDTDGNSLNTDMRIAA